MADAPLTPEQGFMHMMRIGREVFVSPTIRRNGKIVGTYDPVRFVVCGMSGDENGLWRLELRAPTEEERGA